MPRGNRDESEQEEDAPCRSLGETWRALLHSIETPKFVVDREARVIDANPAGRVLAQSCGVFELEGCFRSGDVREPLRTAARMLCARLNKTWSICVPDDGPREPQSWNVSIHGGEPPERDYLLVSIRDISTIVRLEQTARRNEALAAMGSMLADVAHEVRNPLFAITATLDAFEARFGAVEDHRPYLAVWRSEIDRLTALMRNLLEYGKSRHLDLVSMSPEQALRTAARGCEAQAANAGVLFEIDVPRGVPDMNADPQSVAQVFQNLVSNAVQHAPRGTKIELSAHCVHLQDCCWIECVVRDHGPGIAESDLQRIFQPFFSRRRDGTGLGLSIVLRIVERHAGSVSASNHPRGGAEFTVRMPAMRCGSLPIRHDLPTGGAQNPCSCSSRNDR